MNGMTVSTRQSRRGGWDAFAVVDGLRFEGHGGTPAEAEADLLEQLLSFEALSAAGGVP